MGNGNTSAISTRTSRRHPTPSTRSANPVGSAFRKAFGEGKLTTENAAIWLPPVLSEQLYNLSADPWETNNLAGDPAHAEKLAAMRSRLKDTMKQVNDTGLIPEPMFNSLSKGTTIADYAQSDKFNLDAVIDLAFAASAVEESNIPRLTETLSSEDPVQRYWATVGLLVLGEKSAAAADSVAVLLKDEHAVVRTTAAEALMIWGKKEAASKALVADADRKIGSVFPAKPPQHPPPLRSPRRTPQRLGQRQEHEGRRLQPHPTLLRASG